MNVAQHHTGHLFRGAFIGMALSHVLTGFSQGFPNSPVNWGLPAGGFIDGGVTSGYFLTDMTTAWSGDTGSENWTVRDMNGDGQVDLVVMAQLNSNGYVQEFSPGSNSYWKVYLNNGSGFSTTATNWSLPAGGFIDGGVTSGYFLTDMTTAWSGDTGSENWTLLDMNGDARPDLVVMAQLNNNGYVQEFSPGSNSYWKVYLNSGSGFSTTATNWSLPAGGFIDGGVTSGYFLTDMTTAWSGDTGSENWTVRDMNGDARPDLVVMAQLNNNGYVQEFSPGSNSYWKVYLNNGSGFSTSSSNWSLPTGGFTDGGVTSGYFLTDMTTAWSGDTGSENWTVRDMNGDDRPDLVVMAQLNNNGYVQEFSPGSNSYWKVYLNNGSGFSSSSSNWNLPSGGFTDGGVTSGYFLTDMTTAWSGDTGSENWTVRDMNGDARPDLVVMAQLNNNGYVQEFSPGSNSYWKLYYNTGSGFSTSSSNWTLPTGGFIDGGVTSGYFLTDMTTAWSGDTGSENWTVRDMNGDEQPDLVITAQLNNNGYVQEFSPGSNSYWKVYMSPSTASVEENGTRPVLLLAPNPTTGPVRVITTEEVRSLEVFDASGRIVHRSSPNNGTALVDLSGEAAGCYWLRISTGTSVMTEAIMLTPSAE